MEMSNRRLVKNICMDVAILYPLIYFAGFQQVGWVSVIALGLNILAFVCAIAIYFYMDSIVKDLKNDWENYSAFHRVYILSTTAVELGIFIYLGWIGFSVMWVLTLILFIAFLRGVYDD
ncbi:hypothetical protein VPMG_00011 [Vibrio phage VBP32]|uniref:Uncharacterized protein n=2 Tax=Stoningtonvirus VBP47 TaxID=2846606 RepID=M4SLX7_9CAUD|nr:hypothetical protein VPNG_00004 [Vibrio phage VBP47]YP_007676501.1 hypothetical protein VPMG_00011 [Vibrio phage VBP32]AGH57028.1 hypothetical protein VPNG_00004 [Vibrio phage VBP47]AGH57150.1 hypothetical protein VPMG_00011 [Vibrio phage VBP32]WMM35522.1 hypothetical protein [Vibrio phage PJN101]